MMIYWCSLLSFNGIPGQSLSPHMAMANLGAFMTGGVGSGFGPTTGRVVHLCETTEGRIAAKRIVPPAMGVLAFVTAFLGFFYGLTQYYRGHELLGIVILSAVVSMILILVVWTRTPVR